MDVCVCGGGGTREDPHGGCWLRCAVYHPEHVLSFPGFDERRGPQSRHAHATPGVDIFQFVLQQRRRPPSTRIYCTRSTTYHIHTDTVVYYSSVVL